MSIRVACPNGHVLNVKDNLAGMTGLSVSCIRRWYDGVIEAGEEQEA